MSKGEQYQALISDVRQFYKEQEKLYGRDPVYLTWFDDCREINLWTYWQGRGNLDAKILLVGQDWGCPKGFPSVVQTVRDINDGKRKRYRFDPDNPTDTNLAKLFQSIGIDISSEVEMNSDLFFTNFVLGYRNTGLSGGFKQRWLRENKDFFFRLVDIIEPEVIICLGRHVFEGVMMAFDQKVKIKNYNEWITGDRNPVEIMLSSGKKAGVFAMAHCGVMGTLNRNRKKDSDGTTGIALQEKDWSRIQAFLRDQSGSG